MLWDFWSQAFLLPIIWGNVFFTITAESSRAHWLIFIVNMKFIIYAILKQRARAENLKSRSVTF